MRRLVVVLSVVVAALFFAVEPASAQNCGDWFRPMVCTAQLLITDSDYRTEVLGERSSISLGPREQVEIELDARDQRGRRFPADRLAVSFDAYRCGSVVSVDDRGEGQLRVTATGAQGSCTLEVWLPNNLNFAWEVEFEVRADARRGYDRGEAEFLATALYAAVLGREPDEGGLRSAVAEIEAGNLETQVDGMTRSAEFAGVAGSLSATELLEQFYRGVLGREGDPAGMRLYGGEMRRGQYSSVLLKLIRSPEFELRLQR